MRFKEVREVTGLSKTTINRFEKKEGRFPTRESLGPRSIGWFEEDVMTLLESLRPRNEGS